MEDAQVSSLDEILEAFSERTAETNKLDHLLLDYTG